MLNSARNLEGKMPLPLQADNHRLDLTWPGVHGGRRNKGDTYAPKLFLFSLSAQEVRGLISTPGWNLRPVHFIAHTALLC